MISLMLALVTEFVMGFILAMIAHTFGVSKHGYGRNLFINKKNMYNPKDSLPDYSSIKHWNKDTLVVIMFIIIMIGFILFMFYFLLITRCITKDMGYISNCISNIAAGEMDVRITGINRDDEIGEIILQVNRMSDEI